MTSVSKDVSKFVLAFLAKHDLQAEDVKEAWTSTKNQSALKKIVNSPGRKVKDPNAPKRSKSSYLFFCGDEREKIKAEDPEMSAKDITAELGARWKKLKDNNPKLVAKYEAMAKADKERYCSEKESYVPPQGADLYVEKGKKFKDPNAPKRAKSSYLFFCADNREKVKDENPDITAKEITAELGNRWNILKEDGKRQAEYQKYLDMAEKDKARYAREKANYNPRAPSAAPAPPEDDGEAGGTAVAKLTAFQLFCQENRTAVKEENEGMRAREITKVLSRMWKALSPDEQQSYRDQV